MWLSKRGTASLDGMKTVFRLIALAKLGKISSVPLFMGVPNCDFAFTNPGPEKETDYDKGA